MVGRCSGAVGCESPLASLVAVVVVVIVPAAVAPVAVVIVVAVVAVGVAMGIKVDEPNRRCESSGVAWVPARDRKVVCKRTIMNKNIYLYKKYLQYIMYIYIICIYIRFYYCSIKVEHPFLN